MEQKISRKFLQRECLIVQLSFSPPIKEISNYITIDLTRILTRIFMDCSFSEEKIGYGFGGVNGVFPQTLLTADMHNNFCKFGQSDDCDAANAAIVKVSKVLPITGSQVLASRANSSA